MRYERLILLLGVLYILVYVMGGCGDDTSSAPEQINVYPGWPNIEKCRDADTYKMKVRVTGKITSDSAYAWFQILKQDSVILTSEATTIRDQAFATPMLYAYFSDSQIPPGQYDLQTYLVSSLEDVGNIYKRRVADGPRKFTIDYTQIPILMCVAGGILIRGFSLCPRRFDRKSV